MNVKLSKHLKFTVKGFEAVSKGFSFLLEKFGCGCKQYGADDSGTKVSKYLIYFAFNFGVLNLVLVSYHS